MKKNILMMFFSFVVNLHAQDVPLPKWCFPLNGTNSTDVMSGREADIYGELHSCADRFGMKGKAVAFDKGDNYMVVPAIPRKISQEITLTYWMYAGKDSIAQTFWAVGEKGELLLGMKKKGARAVLDIYHWDGKQNTLPDRQWMWSDSNFNEDEGWYFVTVAYSTDGIRFYLGTPGGKLTECYSAFVPDRNLVNKLCIGTAEGIPAAGMDDFKIYDVALSQEQVAALFHAESQISMGEEKLANVQTATPLNSSSWYLHCVGRSDGFRYVLQNRNDLSFLSADAGYGLSVSSILESRYQKWFLTPVKDTSGGRIFTISNEATGMYLTDTNESVLQQVSDNTDAQKWCLGEVEASVETAGAVKKGNLTPPLHEEIYFDKGARVIKVHLCFPEAGNLKVRLADMTGVTLREYSVTSATSFSENIKVDISAVYLVVIESDFCKMSKKIIVNL